MVTVAEVLEKAHRDEWGIVLAATVRVCRDIELAEECVQDAYAEALTRWSIDSLPGNPAAWLTTTAKRRVIDAIRRRETLRDKLPLLIEPPAEGDDDEGNVEVPDERLRLMLLCSHPALAADSRTAMTLRLVCGLSTPGIARAFLVSETTMAARLTRAKRKISGSRIPFRELACDDLKERLPFVLDAVYLVYTAGHTSPSGEQLQRPALTAEAVRLAALVAGYLPDDPEAAGLYSLLIALDARRSARTDVEGKLIPLGDQSREHFDHAAIRHARTVVEHVLPHPQAGRFALQAAIAVLYAEGHDDSSTDWAQILGLYDHLLLVWPSPVVALNRLVPLARVAGADRALRELHLLKENGALAHYHYVHAIEADLLDATGSHEAASASRRRAIDMTRNGAEAVYLAVRQDDTTSPPT